MRIIKTKDYDELSCRAADIIAAQVLLKPDCVLGLATGSSPVGTYKELIKKYKTGALDFSKVKSVNLDEYVGLAPDHEQSYAYFMYENLFAHINIDLTNTNVPSGIAPDAAAECARYDALIASYGRIDLQLLGLGSNGHIGFNEPSDQFPTGTHQVALTDSTIQANKRFFKQESAVPRHARTMGIRDIMQAKRVLMVVSGTSKAETVRTAFAGPVTPSVPASVLQLHSNFTLVADEAALSLLLNL